ncbi:MAG TPA: hypothetical protein DEA08_27695 [Planctomycetes bacterium]|mgnify:CR=1 FL=1|nr:hypothetical protein [Planctomycetota bacterium]
MNARPLAMALSLSLTLAAAASAQEEPSQPAPEAKPAAKAKTPTYYGDIAAIVQKRCQNCHRPGAIGPFPMTTYKEVAGWAAMIHEVVGNGRMPPWHADAPHGTFANDRRLPQAEKDAILAWVDAGAPKGDLAQAPKPVTWPEPNAWRLGKVDAVVEEEKTFSVPATGSVPYQYSYVKTNFDEDKWIKGLEVKVDAPGVVHHVLIFVIYPERHKSPRVRGGLRGYFASALPGDAIAPFPEGAAKFLPKGATLVFQTHYTPNGTAQKNHSRLGLLFAKPEEKITRRVQTKSVHTMRINIPAGAEAHKVRATYDFKQDQMLYGLLPHMHLRGKSFYYILRYPDGSVDKLLDVPKYDFNWQNTYRFAQPRFVPKGSRMIGVAVYDNSDKNPANPDPTRTVRFGEQTWDEMMIGYMDLVEASAAERAAWEAERAQEKPAVEKKTQPAPSKEEPKTRSFK